MMHKYYNQVEQVASSAQEGCKRIGVAHEAEVVICEYPPAWA